MGRMALEPHGAALMVPSELLVLTDCMGTTGWLGRNGARWAFLVRAEQTDMATCDWAQSVKTL